LKVAGTVPYKAHERPKIIRHLIDFTMDIGFETATLKENSDALPLPLDEEPELELHVDECTKSTVDPNDRRQRCGVPYTRAYKEGKAGFYLSNICTGETGKSTNMPSTSFIQKDFINSFFGPILDIWEDLQHLPDERTRVNPNLDLLLPLLCILSCPVLWESDFSC
jgi:hypothetical protein